MLLHHVKGRIIMREEAHSTQWNNYFPVLKFCPLRQLWVFSHGPDWLLTGFAILVGNFNKNFVKAANRIRYNEIENIRSDGFGLSISAFSPNAVKNRFILILFPEYGRENALLSFVYHLGIQGFM